MNEKVSKKIRKEARRLWREYMIQIGFLSFKDRLYIAWRIVRGG